MEYTIKWNIENYSYFWHKNKEPLCSPKFLDTGLMGTSWYLVLYPRGKGDASQGYISFFLKRRREGGPENIELKYELSFQGKNGLPLVSKKKECGFKKSDEFGENRFIQMHEVLLQRKADYLPQDILSVRCSMWTDEEDIRNVEQCYARTIIGIKHISFAHVIPNFSSFGPNTNNTNENQGSTLYFTDGSCCKEKMMMEITPPSTNHNLCKCEVFLLDASGNVLKCGEEDNPHDSVRKDLGKFPLSLTRKDILDRKDKYLTDNKLTLLCKCTFSTGKEYEIIERIQYEMPSISLNQINNDAEKLSAGYSVQEDLNALYHTQLLADVELKTKTKSFHAHKNLLCARSPIFKAMLTNDTKEENSGCIQVDGIENDILEKLLLFLYTDSFENLQWDSATKLYYAADKYAVKKLKVMCSSFLKNNLSSPSTAIDLLLLANTHSNSNLQKIAKDFILKHAEQVFGSTEWRNLIKEDPTLVSEIMCLKYTQND